MLLLTAVSFAQDQTGPAKDVDQTVAKPRKSTEEPAEAPIPSKLSKKAQPDIPENLPSFKSDVNVVSVDVAVVDKNGHFIPNIPRGSFRVLEDNVPQQIKSFGKSTAPMTVCLLVEFSAKFQWYGSQTWYQTLAATYGFVTDAKARRLYSLDRLRHERGDPLGFHHRQAQDL